MTTTGGSSMRSLIRPRTSSPRSPSIRQARALSPRSVIFECQDEDVEHLKHLTQPDYGDFDSSCEDLFFDDDNGNNNDGRNSTTLPMLYPTTYPRSNIAMNIYSDRNNSRSNKRKLFSSELPPRCSLNLRHRKISDETVEWLASSSRYNPNSDNNSSPSHVSPGTENEYYEVLKPNPSQEQHLAIRATPRLQPVRVEELWLGPVFESSQTVLAAIETLPASVMHLDLDLRNTLHLLPEAMPLLFAKGHLKHLSLRVFGDAGAIEVAKWMNQNPNLEHLDLRGNRIGSLGARTIVDAIISWSERHTGTTIDCDDSYPLHRLSHLNLSCNCILHGDLIGQLLALNSTLTDLDLGYNWFGDQDVEEICRGLSKNKSLRKLNLFGCNRISSLGMKAILHCLKEHNTSLHTIGIQAFDEEGEELVRQIKYWLKLNKAGRCLVKSSLPASCPSPPPQQGSLSRHRCGTSGQKKVPMGLWPLALGKSEVDPDSMFFLVREGLSPWITNHNSEPT